MYSFLTLVAHNKVNFTRRKIDRADTAKTLHKYWNTRLLKINKMLEKKQMRDFPITVDDAKTITDDIWT